MFVVSAFKRSICMIVSCGVPSQIESLKVQAGIISIVKREREKYLPCSVTGMSYFQEPRCEMKGAEHILLWSNDNYNSN